MRMKGIGSRLPSFHIDTVHKRSSKTTSILIVLYECRNVTSSLNLSPSVAAFLAVSSGNNVGSTLEASHQRQGLNI